MRRRPDSVTVIGWLFVVAGAFGILAALAGAGFSRLDASLALVVGSRALALLCGALVLRGLEWARFLLVAWVGYHVIVGGLHSPLQLVVHGALLVVAAWALFHRRASAWFRANT